MLSKKKYKDQGQIVGNPFDYSREEIQAIIAERQKECLLNWDQNMGKINMKFIQELTYLFSQHLGNLWSSCP